MEAGRLDVYGISFGAFFHSGSLSNVPPSPSPQSATNLAPFHPFAFDGLGRKMTIASPRIFINPLGEKEYEQ